MQIIRILYVIFLPCATGQLNLVPGQGGRVVACSYFDYYKTKYTINRIVAGINTWKKIVSIIFVLVVTTIGYLRSCNFEILKHGSSRPLFIFHNIIIIISYIIYDSRLYYSLRILLYRIVTYCRYRNSLFRSTNFRMIILDSLGE